MRVNVTPCRAPTRLRREQEAFQIGKILRIDASEHKRELGLEWRQKDNIPAVWLADAHALAWMETVRTRNRMAHIDELSGDAAELFAMWHQRAPQKRYTFRFDAIPKKWYRVGAVHRIDYASDKWDGNMTEYMHDVERGTSLYLAELQGQRLWLCKGKLTVTEEGLLN